MPHTSPPIPTRTLQRHALPPRGIALAAALRMWLYRESAQVIFTPR